MGTMGSSGARIEGKYMKTVSVRWCGAGERAGGAEDKEDSLRVTVPIRSSRR